MIFRWIKRLILLAILGAIILGVMAFFANKAMEPPNVKDAPWAIQTYSNDDLRIPSRIFYAKEITIDEGTPTLHGYWSFDSRRYHFNKESRPFPVKDYGEIKIVRRNE